MSDTPVTPALEEALLEARNALDECFQIFKMIHFADFEELEDDEVCILTLARMGQRIADQASDAALNVLGMQAP